MRRSAIAGWALLLCASPAQGGLGAGPGLMRYDSDLEYEDYSRVGYKPYTAGVFSSYNRPQFDELGNFLIDGRQIYHLEERRGQAPNAGSRVEKVPRIYQDWVGRLLVGYDSYGNGSSRLIVGDRIRTKFTSLTLDLVALNGIRWDWDLAGTQATFVASRVDWPNFSDADNEYDGAGHNKDKRWATYLLGGHVERRVGVLRVGASYVNQHRVNSLVDWATNSLKGVQPAEVLPDGTPVVAGGPPFLIAVRVSDGSDLDGLGARVFDMRIDGELSGVQPVITRHRTDEVDPTSPDVIRSALYPRGRSTPPYIEYLRGDLPRMEPGDQEYFEANGKDYLIYWFEVPHDRRETTARLRFRALVANDYSLSVADVFRPASRAANSTGLTEEGTTYFREVAAARGNAQDLANLRWVTFEYGRPTGRTIVGLRADVEREGLEVKAELARSLHYLQYPSLGGFGDWQSEVSDAWFVNVRKEIGGASVGVELFSVSPRYSTVLSVQDQEFFRYSDDLNSPFPAVPGGFLRGFNNTLDLSTVDDNDDKDRRPDSHFLQPNALPQPFSGHFGDDNGVLPGLDVDQDGRRDTDENGNGVADFLEPFFLYDVDPPEYDYGEDLNNNGLIDHREDDREPDYPYDVDRAGYHLFVGAQPARQLDLTVGAYGMHQVWGEGHSRATYAEVRYRRALYPYAVVDFANKLKRVRDGIRDDYVQLGIDVEDELWMRDSIVNTAYVDAAFVGVEGLRIDQRLKCAVNLQRQSAQQEGNGLGEFAWVSRVDYTWRRGALQVVPRVKYRGFVRDDREHRIHPTSERYLYPILLVSYVLTAATELQFGAQGLPGLRARFRDRIDESLGYDSQDYVAQLTNRTTYSGQHLSLSMGYQLQRQRPKDRTRTVADIDRSLLFIRLVMGLEPFEG